MNERSDRLQHLTDEKLIDIVKNYRQYGYDEPLRAAALARLEERGITQEMLQMTGNFENKAYDNASGSYMAFIRNSAIAFVFYCLILAAKLNVLPLEHKYSLVFFSIMFWGLLIAYTVFLVQSFHNQRQFYKTIGKEEEAETGVLYFLVGMPVFILLFFLFKYRMKEQMKLIV